MKQGKHFFTILLWIMLAAIVAYFGYNVFEGLYEPLTTVAAVEYEAGAGYYVTGFVVRDETVIHSDSEVATLTVGEGAHVSAGSTVAVSYLSDATKQRHSRIGELEDQLKQLRYAYQYSSSIYDQAALEAELSDSLRQLSRFLTKRDMNSAGDLVPEIKGLVLRRSSANADEAELEAQITTMEEELEKLRKYEQEDTKSITVSTPGYFSGSVDGYESILTPEKLEKMTVEEFRTLSPDVQTTQAVGKLIHGNDWYFVTVLPSNEIKLVEKGTKAKLTFSRDFYKPIVVRVEYVGNNEGGYRLLILSADRYLQNITLLRQQSAELEFTSYSGLRVPKNAVRTREDGTVGVYVLEGAIARWKSIQILHDIGESYIVELDKESTSNLWPEDEIIISGRNLLDGKVVR